MEAEEEVELLKQKLKCTCDGQANKKAIYSCSLVKKKSFEADLIACIVFFSYRKWAADKWFLSTDTETIWNIWKADAPYMDAVR